MDFNEFIQAGWGRHENDAEALANDLETRVDEPDDATQALMFINLSNHAVGEHLGDWSRARALAEKVMQGREDSPELSKAFGNLSVAQFMAGDAVAALNSEARAMRLTKTEQVGALVRTRVLLASAMVGSKRLIEGAEIYQSALELVRARDEKLDCDQAIAITSNNLASEFLDKPDRTEAESALMLKVAEGAKEFWLKCGTWENEERADYLLAMIHNSLGDPDKALEYAATAIEIIKKHGEEVVDEAFVNLAMANSFKLKDNPERHAEHLERADELAENFPNEGLKDWYKEERAKVES